MKQLLSVKKIKLSVRQGEEQSVYFDNIYVKILSNQENLDDIYYEIFKIFLITDAESSFIYIIVTNNYNFNYEFMEFRLSVYMFREVSICGYIFWVSV